MIRLCSLMFGYVRICSLIEKKMIAPRPVQFEAKARGLLRWGKAADEGPRLHSGCRLTKNGLQKQRSQAPNKNGIFSKRTQIVSNACAKRDCSDFNAPEEERTLTPHETLVAKLPLTPALSPFVSPGAREKISHRQVHRFKARRFHSANFFHEPVPLHKIAAYSSSSRLTFTT